MNQRVRSAAGQPAPAREPFERGPRYFRVLSVAFIQHKPELDGDVQHQLDAGGIVKAKGLGIQQRRRRLYHSTQQQQQQ